MAAAIGAAGTFLDRARALVDAGVDALVVDTAHGHSQGVLDATAAVREAFPDVQLDRGQHRHARRRPRALVERGVDAVKVGVGPGLDLHHARRDGRRRAAAHGGDGRRARAPATCR